MKKLAGRIAAFLLAAIMAVMILPLSALADGDYTITIAGMNGGTVLSNKTSANEGETVTLMVTPETGYEVEMVLYNGREITPVSGIYRFMMPAENVTITAKFTKMYAVTVAEMTGGSVTSDKTAAEEGEIITLTVTADKGYEIEEVCYNETEITPDNGAYTFKMPASDVTVTATFAKKDLEITVLDSIKNGTVTTDVEEPQVGDTVTVTATPSEGYKLLEIGYYTTDDSKVTKIAENISNAGAVTKTFEMPGENITIVASFAKAYGVTVGEQENGKIVPNMLYAAENETVILNIEGDEGYNVKESSVSVTYTDADSKEQKVTVAKQGVNKYSFVMPAYEVEVSAKFAKQATITYEVTRSSQEEAVVSIVPSKSGTYYYQILSASAPAPDIDAVFASFRYGNCIADEKIILNFDDLETGEYKLYLAIYDAEKIESELFVITIPSFKAAMKINSVSVGLDYTLSDNMAILAPISDKDIADITAETGRVIFDLSKIKDAYGVTIPKSMLQALIADGSGVTKVRIFLPVVIFEFDTSVLEDVLEQATGSTVTFSAEYIYPPTATKLNAAQKEAAGSRAVYDLKVRSGVVNIEKFSSDITVMVPYALGEKENADRVTVYAMDSTGKLTEKETSYAASVVTCKISETGYYVVGYAPYENPFTDVDDDDYFYDPVLWAVENGIATGMTTTTFSPDAYSTRAQAVTFLWRAAGSPKPLSNKNPFTDVNKDDYYYNAVLWAVEKGITNGMTDTTFGPGAVVTRGQAVTFLWRYQSGKSVAAANPFTDVDVDDYFYNAVLWAVKEKVTTGMSATLFSPSSNCTRAHIITFIYRALNK